MTTKHQWIFILSLSFILIFIFGYTKQDDFPVLKGATLDRNRRVNCQKYLRLKSCFLKSQFTDKSSFILTEKKFTGYSILLITDKIRQLSILSGRLTAFGQNPKSWSSPENTAQEPFAFRQMEQNYFSTQKDPGRVRWVNNLLGIILKHIRSSMLREPVTDWEHRSFLTKELTRISWTCLLHGLVRFIRMV